MPSRPAHDPLSEEMDLLTWQEAAARLFDEIAVVECELHDFDSLTELTPVQQTSRTASQTRLDALRRIAARVESDRPASQSDRTPSSGWS